jgi:hypothetical protein
MQRASRGTHTELEENFFRYILHARKLQLSIWIFSTDERATYKPRTQQSSPFCCSSTYYERTRCTEPHALLASFMRTAILQWHKNNLAHNSPRHFVARAHIMNERDVQNLMRYSLRSCERPSCSDTKIKFMHQFLRSSFCPWKKKWVENIQHKKTWTIQFDQQHISSSHK